MSICIQRFGAWNIIPRTCLVEVVVSAIDSSTRPLDDSNHFRTALASVDHLASTEINKTYWKKVCNDDFSPSIWSSLEGITR